MHYVLHCPIFSLQRRVFLGPLGRNELPLGSLLTTQEGMGR